MVIITTIIQMSMQMKATKNFLGLDPDQFSTGEGPGHLHSIFKKISCLNGTNY